MAGDSPVSSDFSQYIDTISQETLAVVNRGEIEDAFKDFLGDLSSSPRNPPQFFGIGGGVASGKNTLLRRLQEGEHLPSGAFVHDPDEVMIRLPPYKKALADGNLEAARSTFEEPAFEIAMAMLKCALDRKMDVIYMRTFSADTIEDDLKAVRDKGYQLAEMHGIFGQSGAIAYRIDRRKETDERTVPLDSAIAKTQAFAGNFKKCAALFEKSYLWDNRQKPMGVVFEDGQWKSHEAKEYFETIGTSIAPQRA